MLRRYVQWPCIRIAELHLIYAEALCQSSRGSMDKAIAQVDIVRALSLIHILDIESGSQWLIVHKRDIFQLNSFWILQIK